LVVVVVVCTEPDPPPVVPVPDVARSVEEEEEEEEEAMGNISPRSDSRGMVGTRRWGISAWTQRRWSQQQKKPYTCRMS
jgi:hypothetical protein